tara:strand:+ start:382 stop:615 length:234 start_codon:yes stop_codon:yes gene_type:complete
MTTEEKSLIIEALCFYEKNNIRGVKKEKEIDAIKDKLVAINYTHFCTELKSKKCPMCNEEKDCEGHNVCEDCGGRSF